MLRIGYVRLRDQNSAVETANLKALGCHVVRAEEPHAAGDDDECAVLLSILDFVGSGDQLVVTRLNNLGVSARAVLELIDRLHQRGAVLVIAEPELTSEGPEGETLRAALEAVASLEPNSRRAGAAVRPRMKSSRCNGPASARWRSPAGWASRG